MEQNGGPVEENAKVFERPIVDRRGHGRTVPMEVLCLGLSRSGTESLCRALMILGLPTYHGFNCAWNHWDCILWREAVDAKWRGKGKVWKRKDFDQVLGEFSATTDVPCSMFATELIDAYPEAKIILNTRPFEPCTTMKVLCSLDWETRKIYWFFYDMFDLYFRQNFRRNAQRVYNDHNALVRGAVPPHRLLEWDVTQGWEPLCKFLGKPIPNQPFPSGNKAEEFLDRLVKKAWGPRFERVFRRFKVAATVLVACLPILFVKVM